MRTGQGGADALLRFFAQFGAQGMLARPADGLQTGLEKRRRCDRLGQRGRHAELLGRQPARHLVAGEGREHQHGGWRVGQGQIGQLLRTVDTVHARHLPVQQEQVEGLVTRVRRLDPLNGLAAAGGCRGAQPERGSHVHQHLARSVVVVDDEHSGAVQAVIGRGRVVGSAFDADAEVRAEVEPASLPRYAVDAKFASHHANQVVTDGQAQAGAAEAAAGRGIGLRERLEEPLQLLRRDADAGVANLEAQPDRIGIARQHLDAHDDLTPFGELDRVIAQVRSAPAPAARGRLPARWAGPAARRTPVPAPFLRPSCPAGWPGRP